MNIFEGHVEQLQQWQFVVACAVFLFDFDLGGMHIAAFAVQVLLTVVHKGSPFCHLFVDLAPLSSRHKLSEKLHDLQTMCHKHTFFNSFMALPLDQSGHE